MKKLIPAIVMLLVSAVVLSTASYAWFTTSTQATASGMSVTAEAPTSILIKEHGSTDAFGSSVDLTAYKEMDDGSKVAQTFKLEPISSTNGVDFFVPTTCEDYSGAIAYESMIEKIDTATDNGTAEAPIYFLDYVLDLKNTGTEEVMLVLEALEFNDADDAIKGAIRVAILDEAGAVLAGGVYVGDGQTANYVKAPKADNDYSLQAIGALNAEGKVTTTQTAGADTADDASDDEFTNIAVGAATTIKSTKYDGATASDIVAIPAVAEGVDGVKTITVRIWIEGQDADCFAGNSGGNVNITLVFNTAGNVN